MRQLILKNSETQEQKKGAVRLPFHYAEINYFLGLGLDAAAFPALAGAFLGFAEDVAIFIIALIGPTLLAFRLRLVLKTKLNYNYYIDSI